MKSRATYIVTILLFSALFTLLFWIFSPASQKQQSITSPLPDFLSLEKNKQVKFLDIWQPILNALQGEPNAPVTTARAALMYDLTSEKMLYGKNVKTRTPMASLTKIMTAIIALENKKQSDSYTVYASNIVGEDSMGLTTGETLTLRDLLYGLFLHSGNDSAEVIASNYVPTESGLPAGRQAFVTAMNDRAKSLGLKDTHFTNPTGLQGDGNQYTTAYDLLVMTRYALENFSDFKNVAETFSRTIPQTTTHKEYFLENETNLISSYPGVKGVKTGYTPEAGLCLVTYLEYKDHKIIGILLNSENRRAEMKDLLDYSLLSQGIKPPPHD